MKTRESNRGLEQERNQENLQKEQVGTKHETLKQDREELKPEKEQYRKSEESDLNKTRK